MLAAHLRKPLRRLRREQSGMSLVELTVGMAIFMFVMTAVLMLLDVATKQAPRDQDRALAVREAQAGLFRMVREMRGADRVLSFSPDAVEILVRLPKDDPSTPGVVETHSRRHVRYSCGDENPGRCVRYETTEGGSMPTAGERVVDRVLNGQTSMASARHVFTLGDGQNTFAPGYVKVRVEVPGRGERSDGYQHKIVLQDAFYARNVHPDS